MQITEDGRPVAAMTTVNEMRRALKLGMQRGSVLDMAPDFDAAVEDFREHTE